jgi:tetratricopeptide (TPR) repeat protein
LLHGLIADVLLTRAANGDDSLGLEIAWHCMRCGRKEEATKHLLLGARASIGRGAVHEAERRLASSLDSLTGLQLSEARLLLVELLQEQGRFIESIALLSQFQQERATEGGRCLEDLASSLTLSLPRRQRLRTVFRAKRYITDENLSPQTRLRALRLAGHIVSCLDSPRLAHRLRNAALESRRVRWTDDEELEWDTQLVYLTHFTHDFILQSEETLRHLQDIAIRANARSAANGRSYRVLFGLALCHRRAGRYAEALEEFNSALRIIDRLGRTSSLSIVYGSLAACYREMGELDAQRAYADMSLASGPAGDYFTFYATFCAADAYQRIGDAKHAEKLMEVADALLQSSTEAQLRQMWLNCKADYAWSSGRTQLAQEWGRSAILTPTHGHVHRRNVSGIARWLAVLNEAGCWEAGFSEVAELVLRTEAASWWDEAERLCALKHLARRISPSFDLSKNLEDARSRVPRAIEYHLARYGIPLS